jgi:hypothetical protein
VEFLLKHETKSLNYSEVLRDVNIIVTYQVTTVGDALPRLLYIKALCLAKLRCFDEALACIDKSEAVYFKQEKVSSIEKVTIVH